MKILKEVSKSLREVPKLSKKEILAILLAIAMVLSSVFAVLSYALF